MNKNDTDIFIEDIYRISQTIIPDSILQKAKQCLLDFWGTAIAGYVLIEPKVSTFLDLSGKTEKLSTILGTGEKTSVFNACFINGMCSHATELDDGHRLGMIHLGSSIISAILAVKEQRGLPDKNLLSSIVVGYEAAVRLSSSIQPYHKKIGYHTSGTCGTIGAALGVSALMGATKEQMKDTLSLAVSSAAGVLEIQEDRSLQKPYNPGRAAVNGVLAAYTAFSGLSGPLNILSGDRGFFSVMGRRENINTTVRQFSNYCIESIYFKPYASCRHCHPSIDAVLNLKSNYKIDYDDITKIEVETYNAAIKGHEHTEILSSSSAKLSIPFNVALAIVENKADIDNFMQPFITKNNLLYLTRKVLVKENAELTKVAPTKRAAIVKIFLKNNTVLSKRVDYPKGEPENPMSQDDVENKFRTLLAWGNKSKYEIERIINFVNSIA